MMSSKKLIVHENCSVNNKNIWYNTLKNPAATRLTRYALKICFADLILSLPYQVKSNAHFVRA